MIYESHDYGVALFNESVETLGQAPGHPFFIGGLDSGVKAVIEKYGSIDFRKATSSPSMTATSPAATSTTSTW